MSVELHVAVVPGMVIGSGRFRILSALGEGATGRVYRAVDQLMHREVALKTLKVAGADQEYRLKKEFRSIVGVTHPNLVRLYDLVVGEHAFFTMELLRGTDFLHWVWGQTTPPPSTDSESLARLRDAFRQLTLGIGALHSCGKLHRDIKPSNVFVTLEGRVVLLDVGLASSITSWQSRLSRVGTFVGTVPYMAPEQGRGREINESADWYSAGVLLYEALSGRLPYESPGAQITLERRALHARMRPLPANVPDDLRSLVRELLSPEPEARPACGQVLQRLGGPAVLLTRSVGGLGARLFGRKSSLDLLTSSLQATRSGLTKVVHVQGAAGLGKTALVESFLWRPADHTSMLVLRSRCHPREHVPYNAIDGLVDDLTRVPLELPDALTEVEDAPALLRVFPVLRRLASFAAVPASAEPANEFKIRHRGFLAFRSLLRWLSARHPLVLFIDDLHWVDRDSIPLLKLLEQSESGGGYLIVYAYRPELSAAPALECLTREALDAIDRVDLCLEPLDESAMRELVAEHLPEGAAREVATIVADSKGVPLVAAELCAAAIEGSGGAEPAPAARSYDDLILKRVARLSSAARKLLHVLSVAGRPVEQRVLLEAVREPLDAARTALLQLQYQGLAHELAIRDAACVDVAHERIRSVLSSQINDGARAEIHSALVAALSALADVDAHQMVEHLVASGETDRGRSHALQAAEESAARGAFHQAAGLYQRAIELKPTRDEWQLRAAMAHALVDSGQPEKGAVQFARAAELLHALDASNEEVVRLRSKAAQHLMFLGHLQPGLVTMRQAVDAVDRPYADTAAGSVLRAILLSPATYLARQASQRRRSSGRDGTPALGDRSSLKLDVIWAAGVSLGWAAPMRALEYQVRHARLAYDLDHPAHIARALSVSAIVLGMRGGRRHWERAMAQQAQARQLAARSKDMSAEAFVCVYSGLIVYFMGQWRDAVREAELGLAHCQEAGRGLTWEMNMARWTALTCRMYLGEVLEVRARMPDLIIAAQARNDLAALATLRLSWLGLAWLSSDNPGEAERQVDLAFRPFADLPYGSLHSHYLLARTHLLLYCGSAEQAWDALCKAWPQLKRSFQLRMAVAHLELHDLRGRCALSLALQQKDGPKRRELIREVRNCISALQRNAIPAARPMSLVLRSILDWLEGRAQLAIDGIERAALGFESLEMLMHSAACRFSLQLAAPGSTPSLMTRGTDSWFREQRIANPRAWSQVLVPGCLSTPEQEAGYPAHPQVPPATRLSSVLMSDGSAQ